MENYTCIIICNILSIATAGPHYFSILLFSFLRNFDIEKEVLSIFSYKDLNFYIFEKNKKREDYLFYYYKYFNKNPVKKLKNIEFFLKYMHIQKFLY